ncbi:DUF6994 family protein [Arthrobacter sp. N1]|uniref:DUF6994 family protein n=1 Tax=Arthrobacter sp. N1 TaxID=619291 RepID=UPI003BB20E05
MTGLNLSFDYHADSAGKDPDSSSARLKADHQLLWTKELPDGSPFELHVPETAKERRSNYLMLDQSDGKSFTVGSDAITNSYTTWTKLKPLFEGLSDAQRTRYLDPPYTIGSAMIWPLRTIHLPAMNTARGFGPSGTLIADRMDLTLECIRRHYAKEPGGHREESPLSPLDDVITNYADFFELFDGFRGFVDFFHFQDLVLPGYDGVRFLLPFNDFARSSLPTTVDEYVTYREATLDFIERRGARMADWVETNHPDIEVVR